MHYCSLMHAQTVCTVAFSSSPQLGERLVFLIGGISLCKPLSVSPIQQVQVEFLDYGVTLQSEASTREMSTPAIPGSQDITGWLVSTPFSNSLLVF